MKALVFGGTTEGRDLAQWLCVQGFDHLICVATDYGATLLPSEAKVQVGRLNVAEMAQLMAQDFTHVVDATHPYAQVVTASVVEACAQVGLPYVRLLRTLEDTGEWMGVAHTKEAVEALSAMEGNVLLTVGAKEVGQYASLAHRCYPRVLPMVSSLDACAQAGIPPKQIIAMQGPFSVAMNQALIDQFDIHILVTKYTGQVGGFPQKIEAAHSRGCTVVVIAPPTVEQGLDLESVQTLLKQG